MKLSGLFFTLLMLTGCASSKEYNILVGTYTQNTGSDGIYSLTINPAQKKYSVRSTAGGIENPGFQSIHQHSGDNTADLRVYSVGEGSGAGTVHALHLSSATGKLQLINSLSADGSGSCSVTATDHHVMIANYSSGNINVFSLTADGSLNQLVQNIRHQGGSINTDRQKGPHAHQVIFDKSGNYLFSNNLGNDLLYVYRYDTTNEVLPLTLVDSLMMEQGGGPRHLALHDDGATLYVLQELTGTISVVHFENERLMLKGSSTVVTRAGQSGAADIHLSPDGKYLYATNRIDFNDITVFKIETPSTLKMVAQYSTRGIAPRNFMITRDGNYLLVGNQRSNEIVVFKRNKKKGTLTDTDWRIPIPAPVCHLEF
jgi:6-phosphogluconolactonase